MDSKDNKYAKRHKGDKFDEVLMSEASPGTFLDVIYDDFSYVKTFYFLSVDEQIKAYKILKRLSEENEDNQSSSEKLLIRNSRHKLKEIDKSSGLKKEEVLRYPLCQEEHHIIRMDCYGCVDARPQHQLSSYYKDMLKKPMAAKQPIDKYDFNQAPCWALFRQFSNFRKIETELKLYLYNNKINPDILKIMGVKDFSDLIFKTFQKESEHMKAVFVEGESERNAFVKALVQKYEKKIRYIFYKRDIDDRYTESLINAMKLYGVCESEKVVITEKYFTERVLIDLKKAKIPTEDYMCGQRIPQNLTNHLIALKLGYLLAARDENGELLRGKDFPSFEVHHKVAVSESGRFPCVAAVNYRNNFLLVDKRIHAQILHGYDKLLVSNGKEQYRCRMEFCNPHITFMAGFSPEDQIFHDWSQDNKYQQRIEEDSANLVSYENCMARLAEMRSKSLQKKKQLQDFNVENVVNMLRRKCASDLKKKGR